MFLTLSKDDFKLPCKHKNSLNCQFNVKASVPKHIGLNRLSAVQFGFNDSLRSVEHIDCLLNAWGHLSLKEMLGLHSTAIRDWLLSVSLLEPEQRDCRGKQSSFCPKRHRLQLEMWINGAYFTHPSYFMAHPHQNLTHFPFPEVFQGQSLNGGEIEGKECCRAAVQVIFSPPSPLFCAISGASLREGGGAQGASLGFLH